MAERVPRPRAAKPRLTVLTCKHMLIRYPSWARESSMDFGELHSRDAEK